MGEKIALMLLAVMFLTGCVGGLSDIISGPPENAAEQQDVTVAEIKALLLESGKETGGEIVTLIEGKLAAMDKKLEQSEAYAAGKKTVTGIWQMLAALGIVGGGGAALRQRNQRKAAETEASTLSAGLRIIEDAIMKAGDGAKPVTANIKGEGAHIAALVDKARALANG